MLANMSSSLASARAGVVPMQVDGSDEPPGVGRVAPPSCTPAPSPMEGVCAAAPLSGSMEDWPPLPSAPDPALRAGALGQQGGGGRRKKKSRKKHQKQQQQQAQPEQQRAEGGGAVLTGQVPEREWVEEISNTTCAATQFHIWSTHSLLFLFIKQVLEEEYMEDADDPLPVLQEFFATHRASIIADEHTVGRPGLPSAIPTSKTDLPGYALRFLRTRMACEPFSPVSARSSSPISRGRSTALQRRDSSSQHFSPDSAARRVLPDRKGRGQQRNYWEGVFFFWTLQENRQNRTPHNTRVRRYTRGSSRETSRNQRRSSHIYPQSAPKHLNASRAEGWRQNMK